MTERSYPWDGTTTGDASLAPYDDDDWSDIWRKLFCRDRTTQGVLAEYLNEMEVSNPSGTQIRVQTGGALVDGKFYWTDTTVNVSVVAPGAGTNYYRVVLRKDFAAQTVRVVLLGPDGAATPTVTQIDGFTWEISLAEVSITAASVITITEDKKFVYAPISDNRVIVNRMGGHATQWQVAGTTWYDQDHPLLRQGGCALDGAIGGATGSFTITLPDAYYYDGSGGGGTSAMVLASSLDGDINVAAKMTGVLGNQIAVEWSTISGGTPVSVLVYFMVFGIPA